MRVVVTKWWAIEGNVYAMTIVTANAGRDRRNVAAVARIKHILPSSLRRCSDTHPQNREEQNSHNEHYGGHYSSDSGGQRAEGKGVTQAVPYQRGV